MPHANRHYLPGHICHIIHRCHKREFLLKLSRDKKRWAYWLFEARKRFGLCVLNYAVTPNHIHLLVYDKKEYINDTYDRLGIRIKGRGITQDGDSFSIKEEQVPYGDDFAPQKGILSSKNSYLWNV